MKNCKSGKIATKFVKDSIEITAPILSISKSVSRGVFPKHLKISKYAQFTREKDLNLTLTITDPLTVLSLIARLFDKLIHEQLVLYFNDYLYKKQSGFRPKYSTQSALLNTSNQ